ncbi:MAG: DUF4242 domain-containing protein [Bacteroidota bacterium]
MKRINSFTYKRSQLIVLTLLLIFGSCIFSGKNPKKEHNMKNEKEMSMFVIEREIKDVGSSTPEELQEASRKSNAVIDELKPDILWEQSYVVDNKLYCVYKATDESLIKEHAKKAGVPANSIKKVSVVINPETGK